MDPDQRADPDLRPFVPRTARIVVVPLAWIVLLGFFVLAWSLGTEPIPGYSLPNRLGILVVGVLLFALGMMLGLVKATPGPGGLRVRNIVRRRTIAWQEIVAVRLVEQAGDPWVTLDLADGTVAAVMAIQRADGERGRSEALRLGRLVDRFGSPPDTTPPM
jgi:hypothetical protein